MNEDLSYIKYDAVQAGIDASNLYEFIDDLTFHNIQKKVSFRNGNFYYAQVYYDKDSSSLPSYITTSNEEEFMQELCRC
jgi:hypothetical protein